MTNLDENTKTTEQIKNKKMVPDDFYRQLKVILEQDDFDIFKTRSKRRLDIKLKNLDVKIQRLLSLKLRSNESIKQLSQKKKQLKTENLKLKETLIRDLDLEVV